MKKVAIFGNTGGGKSTLANRLAELTRLPLYPIDLIQFKASGGRVPHDEYLKAHADLLRRDKWIIAALAMLLQLGSASLKPTRWSTSICLSSRITGG
jgi:adenylate kinase family enzyme